MQHGRHDIEQSGSLTTSLWSVLEVSKGEGYLLNKRIPRSNPSIVTGNMRLLMICRTTEMD